MKESHIGDYATVEQLIEYYNNLGIRLSLGSNAFIDDVIASILREDGTYDFKELEELTSDDIKGAFKAKKAINKEYGIQDENSYLNASLAHSMLLRIYENDYEKARCNNKITNFLINERDNNNIIDENVDNDQNDDINEDQQEDNDYVDNINKVVDQEENDEIAYKGRNKIKSTSVALIVSGIIISSAIIAGAVMYDKAKKEADDKYKTEQDEQIDNNEDIIEITYNQNNDNIQTTTQESLENDENVDYEEQVEEETTYDVHSDEYINQLTDSIYTKLQGQLSSDIAIEYDKDVVDALVRYTHHNYPEYNGYNVFSNEVAYEKFFELIKYKVDVSEFYQGLNNYDNIKNLNNALINTSAELKQYDDEFKAYKEIDNVLNNIDENNYAEAIVLRAYVDVYSVQENMQLARGGVGDGVNIPEQSNVDAAKASECKEIFNKVTVENPNAKLSLIVAKAIDEDENRARGL